MPHSTTNSSSPIPIPGSNNYARNSNPSSFSTPTATTRSTTSNGSDYVYNAQEVSNVGIGFGQSYVYSGVYSPTVPVGRNLQPYPRDYHCCGMDHQNLHDLIQHVDNYHRGMIVHDLYDVNGIIQIPYEANTLYSQYRWDSTSTIPTPVSSIHPGSVHEQKSSQTSTQNNIHPVTSSSVYSVNVPSIYNKHKGSLEYGQSEIGHLNGFDQMGGITAGQNQNDQDLMLLFLCEQNPDPNLSSSTLFEGQTPSSSLEDDPLREFPSKKTLQSPSFSETPRVSSPISSEDNSTVVSPVATDRSITIPNLGQPTASSSSTTDAKTPKGTPPHNSGQDVKRSPTIMLPNNNGQQRNSGQQPRQRSIAASTGVTTQHRRSLSSYGSEPLPGYSDFLHNSRRSSTSNISNISTDQQQYGSIHIPNLGQVNNRPVIQPRRSSTSNLSARPIATTSQSYSHITIGGPYTQYSGSTVDNYPLVGYMPSGETGSGAATLVKYQRIQPKAGVAMSDVYTDPALGGSTKGSKKRTNSVDNKSIKRRVTKSDEPATEAPTSDLADVNRGGEADIYPYKCSVLGCPKAYKNANGLKYHNEHGHAQTGTGSRDKPWACRIGGCLKTYGSKGGLIYHVKHCHPNDLWALP